MNKNLIFCGLSACLFAGCWTVREPVAPDVASVALPTGGVVRVELVGFDARVTTYVPAYGYSMVTTLGGPYFGPCRPCYDPGMGSAMVSTTQYLPKTETTPAYLNRATDILERAGCVLKAPSPQYQMEVRFEGPFDESGDGWAMFGWSVCTLFTADYGAQDWTAKLKIRDLKTGKLVYERDHRQRYEAIVWGPIPFFSPLGSDRTSAPVMQDWCLSMLTEVVVADALDFFAATIRTRSGR